MKIVETGPFPWLRRDLQAPAAILVLSIFSAVPLEAARAMRPLEIKQRYAGVLATLAAQGPDRAVADLVELEQAAVGNQQAWKHVDTLWRAKLDVIRDLLVDQDFDLLMPIVMLHHDAYFRYAESGRRHLAQHSRNMTAELAEFLASRSSSPTASVFAGRVLTSFGNYLWSPSNIGMSAELFLRATVVDPGNELALEGLAAAWERSGDYERAIEVLERARRLRPDDPELRLRLALCRLRSPQGEPAAASRQLTALSTAEAPAWIRSVAFQELARIQLAGEGAETAEGTLRQGLAALPGDQQLSLQLAAILDEQRRRGEAMAILEAIEIGGWKRESSRQTYDFWEPPDSEAIRAESGREMAQGMAALTAALNVAATGAGVP